MASGANMAFAASGISSQRDEEICYQVGGTGPKLRGIRVVHYENGAEKDRWIEDKDGVVISTAVVCDPDFHPDIEFLQSPDATKQQVAVWMVPDGAGGFTAVYWDLSTNAAYTGTLPLVHADNDDTDYMIGDFEPWCDGGNDVFRIPIYSAPQDGSAPPTQVTVLWEDALGAPMATAPTGATRGACSVPAQTEKGFTKLITGGATWALGTDTTNDVYSVGVTWVGGDAVNTVELTDDGGTTVLGNPSITGAGHASYGDGTIKMSPTLSFKANGTAQILVNWVERS